MHCAGCYDYESKNVEVFCMLFAFVLNSFALSVYLLLFVSEEKEGDTWIM